MILFRPRVIQNKLLYAEGREDALVRGLAASLHGGCLRTDSPPRTLPAIAAPVSSRAGRPGRALGGCSGAGHPLLPRGNPEGTGGRLDPQNKEGISIQAGSQPGSLLAPDERWALALPSKHSAVEASVPELWCSPVYVRCPGRKRRDRRQREGATGGEGGGGGGAVTDNWGYVMACPKTDFGDSCTTLEYTTS